MLALRKIKRSRIVKPGFRSIMQSHMALANFAKAQNQQTIFGRIQQLFEFPAQFFYLPARQSAAKDRILKSPTVSIQLLIDFSPALRLGNVVTDHVPLLCFHNTMQARRPRSQYSTQSHARKQATFVHPFLFEQPDFKLHDSRIRE